ncbi:sericin 1-like [Dermacentor silvarum]|uniref:sericin 1-like n=1 Tax=Dermacentor silvarum TaxID=543639 RepID=UPI002101C267|nr:sericin 1-like [Dermacentor silvarum]
MTEARNSGHPPPAFTSFGDEAIPRTSREDAPGSSSPLDNYTGIPNGSWRGQRNTPYYPADVTYTMHGHTDMAENRSTDYRPPVSSSGGDDAVPSTCRAGMEEASVSLEYDGRIPNGTWGGQRNKQYYPAEVASTTYGYTNMAGNGSTGYWPPVSSSGGDEAVPSTSRAGIEETSASLENDGRRQYCTGAASGMTEERNSGHTPPAFTSFGDEAIPSTSREDAAGSSSTLDNYTRFPNGSWGGQRNTPYYPTDVTYTMHGHTDMAENRSTGYRHPVSSSGGDDAVPSTSRAGMEEASANLEYDGRIPNGTWDGQRNTQYYSAEVTSTTYGYTNTAENGSAGYWPPVSSSGGDEAVPSTSGAGMEEASACWKTTGGEPNFWRNLSMEATQRRHGMQPGAQLCVH